MWNVRSINKIGNISASMSTSPARGVLHGIIWCPLLKKRWISGDWVTAVKSLLQKQSNCYYQTMLKVKGYYNTSFLSPGQTLVGPNRCYQTNFNMECYLSVWTWKIVKLNLMGVSEVQWTDSRKLTRGNITVYYSALALDRSIKQSVTEFVLISQRVVIIKMTRKLLNINAIQA